MFFSLAFSEAMRRTAENKNRCRCVATFIYIYIDRYRYIYNIYSSQYIYIYIYRQRFAFQFPLRIRFDMRWYGTKYKYTNSQENKQQNKKKIRRATEFRNPTRRDDVNQIRMGLSDISNLSDVRRVNSSYSSARLANSSIHLFFSSIFYLFGLLFFFFFLSFNNVASCSRCVRVRRRRPAIATNVT